MPRIFVDLDGVLADFDAGFAAIAGMSCREFEELHGAPVFWKKVADTSGFFEQLAWTADGRELWDAVKHRQGVIVLTELPPDLEAEPQKRAWCRRELGEGVPLLCCMPIDKHKFAVAGDVLIAARLAGRLDWEAAGGVIIHHRTAAESLAALAELELPLAPIEQLAAATPEPQTVYRSAIDGRFVTKAYADANPDTTCSMSG
jgi:hypothetical protein